MKKILIAEDDQYLINSYRVKFSKSGFDVRMAFDGDEVFKVLENFTPDIILLDLVMPGKDGFTVLSELKRNEKWKKIPVIVTSNLGQPEDMEKAKSLGADDYLVKVQVSLEDIVNKINTLLLIFILFLL